MEEEDREGVRAAGSDRVSWIVVKPRDAVMGDLVGVVDYLKNKSRRIAVVFRGRVLLVLMDSNQRANFRRWLKAHDRSERNGPGARRARVFDWRNNSSFFAVEFGPIMRADRGEVPPPPAHS